MRLPTYCVVLVVYANGSSGLTVIVIQEAIVPISPTAVLPRFNLKASLGLSPAGQGVSAFLTTLTPFFTHLAQRSRPR